MQLICLRPSQAGVGERTWEYPNPQVSMRIEADRRLKGPQEAKQSFRESSKPEAPSGICFLQKLPDMGTPIRRAPHLPWVPSGYLASFSFVFLKVHWDWMCRCGPNFTSDHKNESFFFPNEREGNRFLRGFLITSVYWITKREFSTRKDGTRNKGESWEDHKASYVLRLVSTPSLASLLESGNLLLHILFLGPKGSLVFLTFMFLAWNDVTLHTLVPIFRVLPKILFVYLFGSFKREIGKTLSKRCSIDKIFNNEITAGPTLALSTAWTPFLLKCLI